MYLRFLSFCKNLNCRDSYGMTKLCYYDECYFMFMLQPDLSGNPFYATQSEKIDFVEPKGLGALRQAQDKLQED